MWKTVDLGDATTIDRVWDIFEVDHPKIPGRRFKVKVLERRAGDFLAVPNVFLKSANGTTEYITGLGRSGIEALDDLLRRFLPPLATADPEDPDRFDWSDPRDF